MGKCQSQQHHLGDAYVRGSQRKHPWRARLFGTEMLGDPNYHNEVLVVFFLRIGGDPEALDTGFVYLGDFYVGIQKHLTLDLFI